MYQGVSAVTSNIDVITITTIVISAIVDTLVDEGLNMKMPSLPVFDLVVPIVISLFS